MADQSIQRAPIPYRLPAGNPQWQQDAWEGLSLYESRDVVARRYHEHHGGHANATKCREIASHLMQGRQYFMAARGAGELARPLLLYYGVLALSRGLILFSTRMRESGLHEHHGVALDGWSNMLGGAQSSPRIIPALPLTLQKGTFSELANATGNAEWTQAPWTTDIATTMDQSRPLGEVGWLASGSSDFTDTPMIQVGDVLSRLPDRASLYEETLGEPARCVPAEVLIVRQGLNLGPTVKPTIRETLITLIPNSPTLPTISEIMAQLNVSPNQVINVSCGPMAAVRLMFPHAAGDTLLGELPPLRINERWANYLVAPLPGGLVLSSLSLLFLTAYAIGMLVRYYPTTWQHLAGLGIGDAAFPLLRAAIALVERRFPRAILDRLQRDHERDTVRELPM